MSYDTIDPQIAAWADQHGLVLFREWAGDESRFCYTSSESGECFQLAIHQPDSGIVTIEAWSIETKDDEEIHRRWDVPTAEISDGLEKSLRAVEEWKRGVNRSVAR